MTANAQLVSPLRRRIEGVVLLYFVDLAGFLLALDAAPSSDAYSPLLSRYLERHETHSSATSERR